MLRVLKLQNKEPDLTYTYKDIISDFFFNA